MLDGIGSLEQRSGRVSTASLLLRGVVACGVTVAVAPLVLALLRRAQVLDHPTARSSHATPVLRGGGVAPAIGAIVALTVTPAFHGSQRWALVVAAATLGLVGLIEDVVGIPTLRRLVMHLAAATVAGVFLLDNLSGSVVWRLVFAAGVVLWLVGFVNAFNFMDGIDGISVAQSMAAGVVWFVVGLRAGSDVLAAGGAIIAGAALGFAPFNLPRARMFLGDVGSYFIGAWLAAVAVLGLRAGVPPEAVLAPLALYVADTGTTLLGRIAMGEKWYLPHRDHIYQRLNDAGWSHVRVSTLVIACIGVSGALGAVSLTDFTSARIAADVAIVGVIAGYLLAPRWIGSVGVRSTLSGV